MPELTAPFVMKNDEKRLVYGPVLVPDEADSDDDVVTADQIENVAHNFVEQYGNIDLMHSLNNVGRLVESYILPMDLPVDDKTVVPKGSWMMGVRVTDDDAWKLVKDKKLGGFSVMALQKTAMKTAEKSGEKEESKRVTLADLGEDWIVNAVSLVDDPAVPKAKWIAIKSKNNDSNIDINLDGKKVGESVIPNLNSDTVKKAIEGSLEHRRRLVDRKIDEVFENDNQYPIIHSTLDDSVIFRLRDHRTDKSHTFQVGYAIDDSGNVAFTDELQEVKIEETVVPLANEGLTVNPLNVVSSNSSKQPDQPKESEKNKQEDEGIMARLMKKLGFSSSNKAEKTDSDTHSEKLQEAKAIIDDLLSADKGEKKEGPSKMNEEQVKQMIDKQMEPVNSKLDDMLTTLQAEAKADVDNEGGDQQETQTDSASKGEESEKDQKEDDKDSKKDKGGDDKTDFEKKYNDVLKELEKAKKSQPFSKRIAGQDNMVEKSKEEEPDRNAFGYKRK